MLTQKFPLVNNSVTVMGLRNKLPLILLFNDLLNKGVVVHILNIGRIDNTPIGKEIARTKEGFRAIDSKSKKFAADLILK